MNARPVAIVITGNGTNCEREAAAACSLGGFDARIVHISELLAGEVTLDDFHFLNLTGGFLDGDDLGSAKVQANRLRYAKVMGGENRLSDQLSRFIERNRPVLGVCNGFQLMVKMGLLPAMEGRIEQVATLTFNDSGRFEDRWVNLMVDEKSPCIFTRGITDLTLPVRHGEGKFVAGSITVLERMESRHLFTVKYVDASGRPTRAYPENPNGSEGAVAGFCSPSGILFGLMPHPEAYLHRVNHPRWTREKLPEDGVGVAFFRNAFQYVEEAL
ncbi:MAG TPA: phosphoribosylformylglycinamidine synthase subunit PurQ [Proteobacteria bacterium]|nr:phosphoribosylformylglycinamidine synthase [bacterium BMS3Abin14]HDL53942.1 phosphoribosylformylglycinamidine synthase subunit PurQ [Pseudomonadota bacterium]